MKKTARQPSITTTAKQAQKKQFKYDYGNEPDTLEVHTLPSVALSKLDKAAQLLLSEDQLTCQGVNVRNVYINMYF